MIDLRGQRFGEWEVLEYYKNSKWLCRCSCGIEKLVSAYSLIHGKSRSCGHNSTAFKDLTGKHFGELEVIRFNRQTNKWLCRCSCGEELEIRTYDLIHGVYEDCKKITHKGLIGKHFGDWEVVKYAGNGRWECKCSCGNTGIVLTNALLNGKSKSCGHKKLINIEGRTFGDLEVLEYSGNGKWKCKCICGNIVYVLGSNLRSGASKSCGCKKTENLKRTMLKNYGVESYARCDTNRTNEQIQYVESREAFVNCILNHFNHKPCIEELSKVLGINESNTLKTVHKYGVESLIDLGNHAVSTYEKNIQSIFGGELSNRTILKGKEIDIYFPDKHIGIEFNGDYWHSSLFKFERYHQLKTIEAENLGVHLIHIFEYELRSDNKKEKIYELLKLKLRSENNRVIYGRSCEVKEIGKELESRFNEKYHLQGSIGSQIALGLFCRDELLGVMTLGKPRYDRSYQYELLRLTFKSGVIVVGGFNKMLKHFIKRYNPQNIVTYCDLSKFTGKSYINAGFSLVCITKPNYVWFNPKTGEVLTRYQTMKHKLLEIGLGSNEDTEESIMTGLNYYKIYDCGNLKFEWRKS